MVSKFTWSNSNNVAPAARNGPNGITLSFFFQRIIRATGKPINEPTKIDNIAIGYVKTMPKMNNSLISPPPIDSFLNRKSPNFFNKYIVKKAKIPFNSEYNATFSPFIKRISTNNIIAKVIKTSSDIIR